MIWWLVRISPLFLKHGHVILNGVPASDVCDWLGVQCGTTNVWRLELSERTLSGTIPQSIGDLTTLERLVMPLNLLSGSIPSSLGNLNLAVLNLANNRFTDFDICDFTFGRYARGVVFLNIRDNNFVCYPACLPDRTLASVDLAT